jgi:hypothetical protein
MEPERLFVRKFQELRQRTDMNALSQAKDADYEVLMAAPLIRELLLGDPPLMHIANRGAKLRIRFNFIGRTPYEDLILSHRPVLWAKADAIWPGSGGPGSNEPVTSGTIDQFLRENVMLIQGDHIDVHALIDYVANAAGGVHYNPDSKKHKRAILAALDQQMTLGGLQECLRSLLGVAWVVRDALEPLAKHIDPNA